ALGTAAGCLDDVAGAGLDVLVNATPVGTLGDSEGQSPVPASALAGVRLVFDLVYAPERTQLLIDAESRGCIALGGRPMLAAQAAMQFELWTGKRVSCEQMAAAWSST
ncbi:MAG: shikimate dehydrogenase, partial [Blastocatellia bacterium]